MSQSRKRKAVSPIDYHDGSQSEEEDESPSPSRGGAAAQSKSKSNNKKPMDPARKALLEARQIRNRQSAQNSRDKKRAQQERLEGENASLKVQLQESHEKRNQLQSEVGLLDGRVKALEKLVKELLRVGVGNPQAQGLAAPSSVETNSLPTQSIPIVNDQQSTSSTSRSSNSSQSIPKVNPSSSSSNPISTSFNDATSAPPSLLPNSTIAAPVDPDSVFTPPQNSLSSTQLDGTRLPAAETKSWKLALRRASLLSQQRVPTTREESLTTRKRLEGQDWNRSMAAASTRGTEVQQKEWSNSTSTKGMEWQQGQEEETIVQTPSAFLEENQVQINDNNMDQDIDMDSLLMQMHADWQMESDLLDLNWSDWKEEGSQAQALQQQQQQQQESIQIPSSSTTTTSSLPIVKEPILLRSRQRRVKLFSQRNFSKPTINSQLGSKIAWPLQPEHVNRHRERTTVRFRVKIPRRRSSKRRLRKGRQQDGKSKKMRSSKNLLPQ